MGVSAVYFEFTALLLLAFPPPVAPDGVVTFGVPTVIPSTVPDIFGFVCACGVSVAGSAVFGVVLYFEFTALLLLAFPLLVGWVCDGFGDEGVVPLLDFESPEFPPVMEDTKLDTALAMLSKIPMFIPPKKEILES